MIATRDQSRVVVADSDRDLLWVFNAETLALERSIALAEGDEPGRLVEDALGHVHVALRSGGAIVRVDINRGVVIARKSVCAAPRGIALDPRANALRVVCVGGELVTVSLENYATRTVVLEPDLRDVVVRANDLVVSTFRQPTLLFLNDRLEVTGRSDLRIDGTDRHNAAYRMVLAADGRVAVVMQRATPRMLSVGRQGYGAPHMPPVVTADVLFVSEPSGPVTRLSANAAVPVDVMESAETGWIVVSAGHQGIDDGVRGTSEFASVYAQSSRAEPRMFAGTWSGALTGGAIVRSQPVFFNREPAGLVRSGEFTALASAEPVGDTGHDVFHMVFNDTVGLACASCHPEGGDDGLVWRLPIGSRRTPSLRGTVANTAPYHWNGEFDSIATLVTNVFTERMGGPVLGPADGAALQRWLESLRAIPAPRMSADVRARIPRGAEVFRSPEAGCAGCHSGPSFTNNASVNVGTAGVFQVPSLIGLAYRAPYMHTGCAASIDARLSSMDCGGDARHGGFGLPEDDRNALAAYLLSL